MALVAVDLAARFSAACVMDDDGNIMEQFDSWKLDENQFLQKMVLPWALSRFVTFGQTKWLTPPDVLVVEDLPYKLPFMKITKKVCQIQGRIEEKMHQVSYRHSVLFLPPATWMRSYGIKTSKDAAKLVQPKAEELGYVPPMDYNEYRGKDRQTARKVNTDYAAAFLIGTWATNYFKEHGTYDAPTTSRFM